MLKRLRLLPVAALLCFTAQAQLNYTFKDTTTAYAPLTGATSLNGSLIWDDEILSAPMPFTWTFNGTQSTNRFNLALELPGVVADTTNFGSLDGFVFGDMDLADRGLPTSTSSLSPIRYLTTGTSPNRIFKMELANAGFYDEDGLYATNADFVNVQVWVYETTNIVELHYGSSNVSHPSDYFEFSGTGPFVGYGKGFNAVNFNSGTLYFLSGSATTPGLDSVTLPTMSAPGTLNAWPASGKVFRFTPKNNCPQPSVSFASSASVVKTVQYTYSGTTVSVDSLIWNFGDGQKQKVTTGFTAPVSHTFATNGKYNVCVTAYKNCGASNTFCKQTPLAISNANTLGNVTVYPNPVSDHLIIEGMQAGDKVTILSLIGQPALSVTLSSNKEELNIAALPAGTYIVVLSDRDGARSSVRIVKR